MEGNNGFEVILSGAQWIALGESVKAIHTTGLSAELIGRVPGEVYSPHWCNLECLSRRKRRAFHCGLGRSHHEERLQQVTDQFLPNNVVEIAHRSYRQLT